MEKQVGVSVVIPTHNESQQIIQTIEAISLYLEQQNYDFEIIVSDNASTDGTSNRVKEYGKDHQGVRLITSPLPGKGPAVRLGVLESTKDYILCCDADLATPIKELERLMLWLREQNYDIAIASREGLGALRKGEPYIRHLMGRIFNLCVRIITLLPFNDTQCGFKLFKKEVAYSIFSRLLVYKDFKEDKKAYLGAWDVEVLLIAQSKGYKIKEIPVIWSFVPTTRLAHVRDSIKMLRDIVQVKLNFIRGKY
ncbi:glycosyltransferase family 2 protein [Candidatus Parcubacteria bacterium]|nr:glycosyltransferase family 2 protein [Patescibacteria group bacterium]MBU4381075.1 glycosyltransferase family 2 protein [Patescibacteria group bacterium]MCG2689203.1 glycosyltransferase family 2 protein [Candidatus Parcubacteria bacterium]